MGININLNLKVVLPKLCYGEYPVLTDLHNTPQRGEWASIPELRALARTGLHGWDMAMNLTWLMETGKAKYPLWAYKWDHPLYEELGVTPGLFQIEGKGENTFLARSLRDGESAPLPELLLLIRAGFPDWAEDLTRSLETGERVTWPAFTSGDVLLLESCGIFSTHFRVEEEWGKDRDWMRFWVTPV